MWYCTLSSIVPNAHSLASSGDVPPRPLGRLKPWMSDASLRNRARFGPLGEACYPKEATDGHSETFALVVFSSYEVKERAPYLGERRLTIAEPVWKTLERESVEALVGEEV
jgi:hypothetical protein